MSRHFDRVDAIDVQVEKIRKLIESAQKLDPELESGLATEESLVSVQRKVDGAAAACEGLDRDIRDLRKQKSTGTGRRR